MIRSWRLPSGRSGGAVATPSTSRNEGRTPTPGPRFNSGHRRAKPRCAGPANSWCPAAWTTPRGPRRRRRPTRRARRGRSRRSRGSRGRPRSGPDARWRGGSPGRGWSIAPDRAFRVRRGRRPVRDGGLGADPRVDGGAASGDLGELGDHGRRLGLRGARLAFETRGIPIGGIHLVLEDHRDGPLVARRREAERLVRQSGELADQRGVGPGHVAEQPVEGGVDGRLADHGFTAASRGSPR